MKITRRGFLKGLLGTFGIALTSRTLHDKPQPDNSRDEWEHIVMMPKAYHLYVNGTEVFWAK